MIGGSVGALRDQSGEPMSRQPEAPAALTAGVGSGCDRGGSTESELQRRLAPMGLPTETCRKKGGGPAEVDGKKERSRELVLQGVR